jgi:WD40 repeat protein
MEQWFNLLIQVAKPIFSTLVYTGTNTLLSSLQEELTNRQKERTELVLNSFGIRDKQANYLQEAIVDFTSSIELANLDWQSSFNGEKALQQQLVNRNNEVLVKVADRVRETALKLPELQKTLEHWPLRLFPSQLLESIDDRSPTPLRVILAPPKIGLESNETSLGTQEIESILAQELREFLSQNYSLHSQVRPTEFLGGAWSDRGVYGEANVKAIFGVLKSEPTLIIESEIEGEFLNFRIAYWGFEQEKYCYATIFKLPYKTFLQESAKARALRWKETRQKLLAIGKTSEEVKRLGGNNTINLDLLEEAEALQAAGIDLRELNFSYQIDRKDVEALCQFLSICQCLVAGWVADIHYLIHYNIAPHLPEWLPQLSGAIADRLSVDEIVRTTVLIYREIFKALANERPNDIPELALKLALSLASFPDKSLFREQVDYSLQLWLQQHHLPQLPTPETIPTTLTSEDRDYLESLKACLSILGDESSVTQVENLLNAIVPCKQIAQAGKRVKFALCHTVKGVSGKVSSLAIASNEPKLVSEVDSSTLELWHLDKESIQLSSSQTLGGHAGKVLTVALSPDGQTLASSDKTAERSYIKVWNLQAGKLNRTLVGHKQAIHSLAIGVWQSENKQFLASGSHKIKLWDLQTGEPFLTLFGHKEWVHSLAISPDGRTLVSGSKDKTVRIWNLSAGELLHTLAGHDGGVKAVAVSPDGQMLLSGSDDATIKLWEIRTGKLLHTFKEHSGAIRAIAIDPDSQYAIAACQDKTIKVWDLNTGKLLQTLKGHQESVSVLAISPDGQTLVSGSEDKTLKIWRTL